MAMVMENQQPLAPMPAPPLPPPPPPPLPPPLQAYKHRCKVCQKGFMCGRALGGHMRSHGVTDDGLSADDALADDGDDDSGPSGGAWDSSEAAAGGTEAAAATTKRMYSLRTNAGWHKNCRVCESCGKEFTSWKSLLDHGRECNYDQEKDDLNIAGADIDGEDEEDLALAGGWSKGKRTRRTKVIVVDNGSQIDEPLKATSREEEDLANCLVMMASSSGAGVQPQAITDVHHQQPSMSKDERGSASKDDQQRFFVPPQPISMLPPTVPAPFKFLAPPQVMPSPVVPRGLFECKACKKVFTSHQALGGHRASHKKVKGCFAAKLEESSRNDSPQPSAAASNDNIKVVVEAIPAIVDATEWNVGVDDNAEGSMMNARTTAVVAPTSAPEIAIMQVVDEAPSSSTVSPFKKKEKVHECSICHRVFMSGQALGGHKRCHWLTNGAGETTVVTDFQPFDPQFQATIRQFIDPAMNDPLNGPLNNGLSGLCLDLNVPMNQSADPSATRQAADLNESVLSLNAPASLYKHSLAGHANASNMHNAAAATSGHYDLPEATATEDDEADSTSAKRAKISDLKDMNVAGETSPWLQVGIALPSETNE